MVSAGAAEALAAAVPRADSDTTKTIPAVYNSRDLLLVLPNKPPVLLGEKENFSKCTPPLVRGGGFCEAKDGGVVVIFLSLSLASLASSLVRGSRSEYVMPVYGRQGV